ncbi:MAG: 2-oxo acid dehydrogenase subunit E2, partial [Pyrinomonadaceae bacterium]
MNSNTKELSAFFEESFGSNAAYVEGLLNRYKKDPNLVDDTWQAYFGDLLNGIVPQEATTVAGTPTVSVPTATVAPQPQAAPAVVLSADTEPTPLTGAAKKIVENMEASLTVPTATSFRNIPVKVLEENRRIINDHLASRSRGKASFTHFIAWAIVQAAKEIPSMNFGFGVVDGKPSRLEHEHINLGIAIDIEKKDGSRSLLVPNIKAAESMNFAEFFAAYNEQIKKARDGKLEIADFQGTTISITNPGTIGTAASNPRLMAGQSAIIATGSIEYPAEYQAMTDAALSMMGISKTLTLTST